MSFAVENKREDIIALFNKYLHHCPIKEKGTGK